MAFYYDTIDNFLTTATRGYNQAIARNNMEEAEDYLYAMRYYQRLVDQRNRRIQEGLRRSVIDTMENQGFYQFPSAKTSRAGLKKVNKKKHKKK